MSIRITADSPADLPKEICERYGVNTVPLHIILGDGCFDDGITVTPDDIYDYYERAKALPKTSAVSVAEYASFFEKLTENGDSVIHFCISSGISSTYQNAVLAAEDFPNVFIIDSKSFTTGIALLVIKAAEMAQSGMSAEQVALESSKLVGKMDTTFIVSNLEFLRKGGRCSGVAAFGANLLGIKPSITIDSEGRLIVDKKYRGKLDACIEHYINDLLEENKGNIDNSRAVLARTDGVTDEIMDKAKKQITDAAGFKEVIVSKAGCTITSHCGKGTFCFMFMRK